VRFGQEVQGLRVYGTYAKAAVDASGRVVSVVENLASGFGRGVAPARVDEGAALAAALELHHPGRSADDAGFWHVAPTAERVAIPRGSGFAEGFLVVTWTDDDNILWHTLVDGSGKVVHAELRTNTDTYKIFPDHPGNSMQTVVSGPGAGNAESPIGWVFNDTTIGNNVDAYLDRDNNNAADTNGRPISSTQNFEYTVDLTQDPTITINQQAAVANLFYFNNVIHDKLYRHGFVEGAGNFQQDNFGKGGSGNDPVNAEAQDGGGTNNANFATPSDGSRPRMQMYLWTFSTPNRDGDLDSDIVWHEYGHGLTWRMIGSMSGPMSGAIGEGMSDVLSIYINRNDVVGEYSFNDPLGIRRFPYTDYPNTYGDMTGSSVHSDGEIYAATMWKLLELWEAAGLTQDELFDYVVDGMNFTPAGPAMEDMRDGILASSPTQEKDCIVWTAFAQFGIGEGADGAVSCNGPFNCSVSITESFAVPSVCEGGDPGNTAPVVAIDSPADGASFTEGDAITFSGSATDAEDGDLSGSLAWTSSLDGSIGSGASFTTSTLSTGSHTITASVTDSGGANGSDSIGISVQAVGGGEDISLSAVGYKVQGRHHADLTWSGATSTNVDVFRNGALITTTANDGFHTDATNNRGGATYDYQVCEAGTTTCSNVATVVF
jgi:extracellular elastinolytic metalloproteinase